MHLLNPAPFGRILPAMVTPMKPDGERRFRRRAEARQAPRRRWRGRLWSSTAPPVNRPSPTWMRRSTSVSAVKEVVDVPVISGAGSNDTAHTVRMVEQTQEAGADAVLVVMPYYSRPAPGRCRRPLQGRRRESAEKPIIVYDVPARTGSEGQGRDLRPTRRAWITSRRSRTPPAILQPQWRSSSAPASPGIPAMTACSCRSSPSAPSASFR